MIPGSDARDQFQSSEPTHWVSTAPTGSEDVITLTKAQLQKLLRALETQEPSDTIATASVPTITNGLSKLPISGDDCLPNWVKRNSRDPRGTQHSNESSLAGFSQRLSNSHPELGTASSRPFSKLAQKQRQWEKERAEMQEWHPWGRPGGGAPRCQPVAAVPPRTDAQVLRVQATTAASSTGPYPSRAPSPPTLPHLPPNGGGVSPTFVRRVPPYLRSQLPFGPTYDVQEDEKDEVKKQWIQELEHQRTENHRRGVENRHASLSNGSCWADSESLGSEKLVRPGEDCSESVWSVTRGQGFRPGTDAKMSTSDEKRIRALEYQRAIQAQMQEKQERLRAEREARIREEREQERRLEEERRKLELEYQEEQRKLREKKEREEKARLLLITKMQQAAEEAEALRKARRSQRFHHLSQPDQGAQQLGNFDSGGSVDADFSTSLERISSSMAGISNIASEEQTDLSTQQNFSSAQMSSQAALSVPQLQTSVPTTMAPSATVRPLRGDHSIAAGNKVQREMCSQTDGSLSSICSSRCSLLSSAGTVELSPYIKNRVLTPTKVRIAQHALRFQQQRCREFGTQTDISLPCGWNHSILCDNTIQLAQEFETRRSSKEEDTPSVRQETEVPGNARQKKAADNLQLISPNAAEAAHSNDGAQPRPLVSEAVHSPGPCSSTSSDCVIVGSSSCTSSSILGRIDTAFYSADEFAECARNAASLKASLASQCATERKFELLDIDLVDGGKENGTEFVIVDLAAIRSLFGLVAGPECGERSVTISKAKQEYGLCSKFIVTCGSCDFREERFSSPRIADADRRQNNRRD
ncbi:hypothetical protein HPB51_018797 [Rhipicephalus microplus]|uniref:CCDC66 domain-containing protein n=1 Tax=Rhipicephalus microplus TaxID=6941 RepID=A0A9J6DIA1_RHIMP|nr:hypothetical protein HPB51_018797 [Rhipicephalus microplus]